MNCAICYEQITLKTTAILVDTSGKVVCECEDCVCVDCAPKLNPKRCPTCRATFSSFTTLKKGIQLNTTTQPQTQASAPQRPTQEELRQSEIARREEAERQRLRGIRLAIARQEEEEERQRRVRFIPAPAPRKKSGATYKVDDDVIIRIPMNLRENSVLSSRRAKIIKINASGFTCQFYKYHYRYERLSLYDGKGEYHWTNTLEEKKHIIKDMSRVDRNVNDNDWIKYSEYINHMT